MSVFTLYITEHSGITRERSDRGLWNRPLVSLLLHVDGVGFRLLDHRLCQCLWLTRGAQPERYTVSYWDLNNGEFITVLYWSLGIIYRKLLVIVLQLWGKLLHFFAGYNASYLFVISYLFCLPMHALGGCKVQSANMSRPWRWIHAYFSQSINNDECMLLILLCCGMHVVLWGFSIGCSPQPFVPCVFMRQGMGTSIGLIFSSDSHLCDWGHT